MECLNYPTEAEAIAACAQLDAHFGYPKTEYDQFERPVLTERYTTPIPFQDGTWCVVCSLDLAVAAGIAQTPEDRDIPALRVQDPPL